MTGEEIGRATPWEINRRIEGYQDRMRMQRIFVASFITAPVINAGYRRPKRSVTARKLVPQDFPREEITEADKARFLKLSAEAEERRTHGGEDPQH